MNAISLIREQMKTAHEWFEATMADVTPEQAHWLPPGTAHPIGSRYAHTIVSEDMMVNGLLKGNAPMFATAWAGKTGISGDPQAAFQSTQEWARSVQVDLPPRESTLRPSTRRQTTIWRHWSRPIWIGPWICPNWEWGSGHRARSWSHSSWATCATSWAKSPA